MENDKEESTLDEIHDIIQAFIKSATEITFSHVCNNGCIHHTLLL